MDLFGNLLELTRTRVDPDVKLFGVRSRALVYKETVAGPNIDDYSLAGMKR